MYNDITAQNAVRLNMLSLNTIVKTKIILITDKLFSLTQTLSLTCVEHTPIT